LVAEVKKKILIKEQKNTSAEVPGEVCLDRADDVIDGMTRVWVFGCGWSVVAMGKHHGGDVDANATMCATCGVLLTLGFIYSYTRCEERVPDV
jgi:hypothetical protein